MSDICIFKLLSVGDGVGAAVVSANWVVLASLWEAATQHNLKDCTKICMF
jgi:hypothetical protein